MVVRRFPFSSLGGPHIVTIASLASKHTVSGVRECDVQGVRLPWLSRLFLPSGGKTRRSCMGVTREGLGLVSLPEVEQRGGGPSRKGVSFNTRRGGEDRAHCSGPFGPASRLGGGASASPLFLWGVL
jgi:hypothetical protein